MLSRADEYPVLLVEDNEDDILITQRMWKKTNIENPLHIVRNGEQALDFIFRSGEYSDAPEASLILLDLKMPKVDGFEVLSRIRDSDSFERLPVIILTGSSREQEMNRANNLGCDGYLVKPLISDTFINSVAEFPRFRLFTDRARTTL